MHKMSKLIINGGRKLNGDVLVHGAKNSSLPLLAASFLCNDESVIHNCPDLSDVDASIRILKHLGCTVERDGDTITVNSKNAQGCDVPDVLMREMRSSIIFLGAVLAKNKRARLSFPGGCELGPRPIDLHLKALRQMGVEIFEHHGMLECIVNGELKGVPIQLAFPSVGTTENIMISAVTAKGITTIINAAREPEICDLAEYLNKCGARISGHGCGTIYIEGVESLKGCEHTVIPDRIAAATFMAATAVTGGRVNLKGVVPEHLMPFISVFHEAGCDIKISDDSLLIDSSSRLSPMKNIRTMPYPGFSTDAQAIVMAMACVADGTSVFVENIFDSRYKHAGELCRLGAKIKVEGRVAIVEGVRELTAAATHATDLRGAAAIAVASLCAQGTSTMDGLHHLDRGYDRFEERMRGLNADIRRE